MCSKCEGLKSAPVVGLGWHDMSSAPKDGSVTEIEIRWGSTPWRGLFRWNAGDTAEISPDEFITGEDITAQGWRGVPDATRGILSAHAWRAFKGDPNQYADPYSGFDAFDYVIRGKRPLLKLAAAEISRAMTSH